MNKKTENDEIRKKVNKYSDPLTCIRNAYTLSTTPKPGNEADDVIVGYFLHTLAEIALAVASRKAVDKEVNS